MWIGLDLAGLQGGTRAYEEADRREERGALDPQDIGINWLNNRAELDSPRQNGTIFAEVCRELEIDSKYYMGGHFCNNLSKTGLNMASINIRSLSKNFISLKQLIDNAAQKDKFIDIIGLQETYEFFNDRYNIDDYTLTSNTRQGRKGGGTALYINKKFVSSELKFPESFIQNLLEATIAKVQIPKFGNIVVANIYHPPSQPRVTPLDHFQGFLEALTSLLDKLVQLNLPIVLMGDFNIDLLEQNSENATQFLNTLVTFGHIPHITRATRIEKREIDGEFREKASLIDNIFLSTLFDRVENSGYSYKWLK